MRVRRALSWPIVHSSAAPSLQQEDTFRISSERPGEGTEIRTPTELGLATCTESAIRLEVP